MMNKLKDLMLETEKLQEQSAIKNEKRRNEDPELKKIKDKTILTILNKILENKKD